MIERGSSDPDCLRDLAHARRDAGRAPLRRQGVELLVRGEVGGEPLEGLQLTCSQYLAYWDGKNSQTGGDVAPGIYLYRLEVDGKVLVKKLIIRK